MHKIYVAKTIDNRIKAVFDQDCLPADATHVHSLTTTANLHTRAGRCERFFYLYSQFRVMEHLGFTICIDFGDYFYETGGKIKLPHSQKVNLTL